MNESLGYWVRIILSPIYQNVKGKTKDEKLRRKTYWNKGRIYQRSLPIIYQNVGGKAKKE